MTHKPVQQSTQNVIKFMFSKKATKIDKTFTVDLTLCSDCQIDGEDFVNFYGLLRIHELFKRAYCPNIYTLQTTHLLFC